MISLKLIVDALVCAHARAHIVVGLLGLGEIARRAVMALGLWGAHTHAAIDQALDAGGEDLVDALDALNSEYYASDEPIFAGHFFIVKESRAMPARRARAD
jgi:hypothetical protein